MESQSSASRCTVLMKHRSTVSCRGEFDLDSFAWPWPLCVVFCRPAEDRCLDVIEGCRAVGSEKNNTAVVRMCESSQKWALTRGSNNDMINDAIQRAVDGIYVIWNTLKQDWNMVSIQQRYRIINRKRNHSFAIWLSLTSREWSLTKLFPSMLRVGL